MLINIANVDTEYEEKYMRTSYNDMSTLDRSLCWMMSHMLYDLAEYSSEYPEDFDSLEDWHHILRWHANTLREYYNISEVEDEAEEVHIIEDTKEAIRFVADYLEDLWFKDADTEESDI